MEEREDIKKKVLDQALITVPTAGWSKGLLETAAQEVGVDPSYGWRLFPQGPIDAISYWSYWLDREMLAALPSPENLRVREKVALAVKTRLILLTPFRAAARKTAKYLAIPAHIPQASRLIYKTVNEIWYYAGDTATDYNFYTKRALLGWVYSSTFLYWLKDKSQDFEKTWAFLDHRISEVLSLSKLPQTLMKYIFPWRGHG